MSKRPILTSLHGQDLGLDRHNNLVCKGLAFNSDDWDEDTDLPVPDDSELEEGETPTGNRLSKAKIALFLASDDQTDEDANEPLRLLFLKEFAALIGFDDLQTLIDGIEQRVGVLETAVVVQPPDDGGGGGGSQAPADPIQLQLVTFDGADDELKRSADFVGNADSKLWCLSVWFQHDESGVVSPIMFGDGGGYSVEVDANDKVHITAENAAGTVILECLSDTLVSPVGLHHLLFAVNMADPAKRLLLIDGVAQYNHVTYTDDLIDFTKTIHYIGSNGGSGGFSPQGVTFDATNDYSTRGAALTGAAASKLLTFSGWFRRAASGVTERLIRTNGAELNISFGTNNRILITAENAAGTQILNAQLLLEITDTNWHHVSWSSDQSDAAKRHAYIDGAAVTISASIYTDDLIAFNAATDWAIGASTSGGAKYNGSLSEWLLKDATYIDLSIAANRQKFYNGGPVDPGSDGATALGVAARIYMKGDAAVWNAGTNAGTGGNFTMTGAVVDASTDPGVGAAPATRHRGDMGHLWSDPGRYLDFTDADILRAFRTTDNEPVDLGPNGGKPTGVPPLIYIHGDKNVWNSPQQNFGLGGPYAMQGSVVNSGEADGGTGGGGAGTKPSRAQMQGVWPMLDGGQAGVVSSAFLNAVEAQIDVGDNLIAGVVLQIPWWKYETAEGVYDDAFIATQVAAVKAALGDNIYVSLKIGTQTFGSLDNDPTTCGPPAYIINDHATYGGVAGSGGCYLDTTKGNWRSARYRTAMNNRVIAMYQHINTQYNADPNVVHVLLPESVVSKANLFNGDYSAAICVTAWKALIAGALPTATGMHYTFALNFINAGNDSHVREVYNACVQFGCASGGPDLYGGNKIGKIGGREILDDNAVPNDMSVQWLSYAEISNGGMTTQQMLNTGINTLKMRICWPSWTGPSSGTTDFVNLMTVIRNNANYSSWAQGNPI